MLNVTEIFCDRWGLSINLAKTKIVVFRRGGVRRANERWYYKEHEIEVVPMYKYLGILFTSTLCWDKAVNTLSMQAKKALGILTRYSYACGGLPMSIAFHLFDKLVKPVVLYGAEIWGFSRYKSLEDVQIMFCKKLLGVPKHASNLAVLGECGRYPLFICAFVKNVKYWLKLTQMNEGRYARSCYLKQMQQDLNGRCNWVTHVRELLQKYGFGDVWVAQGVNDVSCFIHMLKQRLVDCYCQEWCNEIRDMSKLSIYCMYKTSFQQERYLHVLNIMKFRRVYAKFRCSNHVLEIEQGRKNGILMENRICKLCERQGTIVLEDEYHFLLKCSAYDNLRCRYSCLPQATNSTFQDFINIMSSDVADVIQDTASYLYHAFALRSELLVNL